MNLRPGAEMMTGGEGTKLSCSLPDLITRKCGLRIHFILDMGRFLQHGSHLHVLCCRLDSTHVNGVVS
jgi:hypothetical protein